MRFLIEFDGVIANVEEAWHAAHASAASAVGWAKLDRATFWRLLRAQGFEANFLPGAKPVKQAEHVALLQRGMDVAETIARCGLSPDAEKGLVALAGRGALIGVTLGANVDARREWLARHRLGGLVPRCEALHADARRRPAEIVALAEKDRQAMVVAGGDALVRSADGAGVFTVGVSTGPCVAARLHRAGARMVFGTLDELAAALRDGAPELVRAGLPTSPIG